MRGDHCFLKTVRGRIIVLIWVLILIRIRQESTGQRVVLGLERGPEGSWRPVKMQIPGPPQSV